MKRILAVASGKGGVGKTWFSISFSQALARLNRRVLLVDCDVGLANVDVQLGLNPKADLQHVFRGEIPFSQAVQPVPSIGVDVLPARAGGGYLNGLDDPMVGWIQSELHRIASAYDIVILDLPSGLERGVRALLRYADDEVIVTTGEPTALTDAYALIKATRHDRRNGVPKLLCNVAEHVETGRQTLDGLRRVCKRFLDLEPNCLGVIRRDPRIPEAISRQAPLLTCYPKSSAAKDIMTVAETFLASRAGS